MENTTFTELQRSQVRGRCFLEIKQMSDAVRKKQYRAHAYGRQETQQQQMDQNVCVHFYQRFIIWFTNIRSKLQNFKTLYAPNVWHGASI